MDIPPTGKKARMGNFLSLVTEQDIQAPVRPATTLSQALSRTWEKKSKYGNRRTEYNGRMFDSALEARHARELDLLRRMKDPKERVTDVQYQVRYPMVIKGQKICTYIADFVVTYADKRVEVVDAKGVLTDVYKLKKKLMKVLHSIDIIEV